MLPSSLKNYADSYMPSSLEVISMYCVLCRKELTSCFSSWWWPLCGNYIVLGCFLGNFYKRDRDCCNLWTQMQSKIWNILRLCLLACKFLCNSPEILCNVFLIFYSFVSKLTSFDFLFSGKAKLKSWYPLYKERHTMYKEKWIEIVQRYSLFIKGRSFSANFSCVKILQIM